MKGYSTEEKKDFVEGKEVDLIEKLAIAENQNKILTDSIEQLKRENAELRQKNKETLNQKYSLTGNLEIDTKLKLLGSILFGWHKYGIEDWKLIHMIETSIEEIEMQFKPFPNQLQVGGYLKKGYRIKKGDIVEANLGYHLDNEQCGNKICIVVDSSKPKTTYIVPISKGIIDSKEGKSFLEEKDAKWYIDYFKGKPLEKSGTILAEYSRYINPKRITRVVGRCLPSGYQKVVEAIKEAHNFSKKSETIA